jgi:hypothetical protein
VTTRALPPLPPSLECVMVGSNSLKLKWGDGKNPDLVRYCLEMMRESGRYVYLTSILSSVSCFKVYNDNLSDSVVSVCGLIVLRSDTYVC